MLKRILVVVTLALAVFASAQTSGSYGQGYADNGHGLIGGFDYNVRKTVLHDHTAFDGYLHFLEQGHHGGIEMGHPDALQVDGHGCVFSGPGSLTTLDHEGHKVTVHGRVTVHVRDNRDPHHPKGDPDTFAIEFVGDHDVHYSFAGAVTHGDLVVFSK
jgi:hypothetical protein